MGWDSNPRGTCAPAGFQDRCLQPLGHPSDSCRFWSRPLAYARLTFAALTLVSPEDARLRERPHKTGAFNRSATHPAPANQKLRRLEIIASAPNWPAASLCGRGDTATIETS